MARCSSPLSESTNRAANFPKPNCAPLWASLATCAYTSSNHRMADLCARPFALAEPYKSSPLSSSPSFGLEGYEEMQTAEGIVFYRQLVVQDAMRSDCVRQCSSSCAAR